MAERDADTVVILSSELIAKITEEYFNKTMFKQKVEIVDLKPTDTGYMFSVAFVKKAEPVTLIMGLKDTYDELDKEVVAGVKPVEMSTQPVKGMLNGMSKRDSKGKFAKAEVTHG